MRQMRERDSKPRLNRSRERAMLRSDEVGVMLRLLSAEAKDGRTR